jgi:hypothetical protein
VRREPIGRYFIIAIASALLVSADPVTIQQFSLALREISISPEIRQEVPASIRLLTERKFDAVLIDLQRRGRIRNDSGLCSSLSIKPDGGNLCHQRL